MQGMVYTKTYACTLLCMRIQTTHHPKKKNCHIVPLIISREKHKKGFITLYTKVKRYLFCYCNVVRYWNTGSRLQSSLLLKPIKFFSEDLIPSIMSVYFSVALQPKFVDHTQLDTHTHTPSSTPLNEWSARRTGHYLHNTQQTQETNIRTLSRFRTRDLRPHDHRDWQRPCC
jgi:hypothetical protein